MIAQEITYYCLDEVIYESPHSTLYRALTKHQTRQVVLKCFEPDAQGMYLREMSGFGISHPHVVTCLDTFYLSDGRPCMVYEFFHAGTVEQWLATHGRVDLDFCYRCLEDILQALIYLNQAKRIHCDIKPGNIFLRLTPTQPPCFVLGDLGATCSLREAQESRYGVGTPAYMAPERLYDRFFYNSDLYSLGVLAFELITGERPFVGTPEEIKRAHLGKIADLNQISHLPLRDFIEGLLEKDPALRIADANTALQILTTVQQGQRIVEPTQVKPQPLAQPQPPLLPRGFVQYSRFCLTSPQNKLRVFEVANNPMLGLEYDSHIELVSFDNQKHDMVLKNGMTQIHHTAHFFYISALKLFRFDLANYQRHCLYQFNKPIHYFQINGDYLLLHSKYDTVYCDLQNNAVVKFSQPHYFSMPQSCILSNGTFCLSGGMMNQLLILRDNKTNIVGQWPLKGPIIAVTARKESFLVLTLDMQNSNCYWLYSLNAQQQLDYIIFSHQDILQYCQTEGYFFWINDRCQLYMCDIDLIPRFIAQLPIDLPIVEFQLSVNHRWLIILTSRSKQEYNITYFKADGESYYA